jgi:hypothetical protein
VNLLRRRFDLFSGGAGKRLDAFKQRCPIAVAGIGEGLQLLQIERWFPNSAADQAAGTGLSIRKRDDEIQQSAGAVKYRRQVAAEGVSAAVSRAFRQPAAQSVFWPKTPQSRFVLLPLAGGSGRG